MRPVSGILFVDGFFDIVDFLSSLVHVIRVQRNVYADLSASAVSVCITIEVVPVPRIDITAAVAGHLFQQFGSFLSDLVGSCDAAPEKLGRESRWSRIAGNCRQTPGLTSGEED